MKSNVSAETVAKFKTKFDDWYESRRNELLTLLDAATRLPILGRHAEELRQISRKCQENAFEIVLVSEFQGGKSTTFNALCDGRDISPRGIGGGGIKTSAAIISAQNIAEESTEPERAEVSFKTPEQIALSLSTLLRIPLSKSEVFRSLHPELSDEQFVSAISSTEIFPSLVDITNPKHHKVLLSCVKNLWDDVSALSSDQRDQLKIATLQLRFFGTPEYQAATKNTEYSIAGFQRLVKFPDRWRLRWKEGFLSDFRFEEIAFTFVQRVVVHIRSKNLARLGCRITDCPGLLANAFDTEVAERAIRSADGVWYLYDGDVELGEKELQSLRKISSDWKIPVRRTQLTANIRTDWKYKSEELLEKSQKTLQREKLPLRILPYNARLAFLGAQGHLLLDSPVNFSETDLDNMTKDADISEEGSIPSPKEMWSLMVERIGTSTGIDEIGTIRELNDENVLRVSRTSNFDETLHRLENEFIPQKARSILIDGGSVRAKAALEAYEGILKAEETAAETKESQWRAEVKKVRTQLDDFVRKANSAIDGSALNEGVSDISILMAREVLDIAFDESFKAKLSDRLNGVIKKRAAEFYVSSSNLKRDIIADASPIVSEAVKETLSNAMFAWRQNDNTSVRQSLARKIEYLETEMRDIWKRQDIRFFGADDLAAPALSADFFSGCRKAALNQMVAKLDFRDIAFSGRLDWIGKWAGPIATLAGAMIELVAKIPGLGALISAAGHFVPKESKGRKDIIRQHLDDVFSTTKPTYRRLHDNLSRRFRETLTNLVGKIRESMSAIRQNFELERVKPAETQYEKSQEDRNRLAKANKEIRTKTIEPLRIRLQAFAQTVSEELRK